VNRLVIEGLVKRYPQHTDLLRLLRHPLSRGSKTALDGIDCELEPGEIYGLVGPNGAGKTTLLKTLAGLVLPTEGRVLLDGVDLSGQRRLLRERVGFVVADERSFYWRLSVRENLRFFADLQGLGRVASRKRVDECLEMVELTERAGERFHALSTGMRQRLALARGLLANPPILLADEATRSLDPEAAGRLRQLLRGLFEGESERMLIYSSHNLAEVSELCTQVIAIRAGRISARRTLRGDERRVAIRTRGPLPLELLVPLDGVIATLRDGELVVDLRAPETLDLVIDTLRKNGIGILEVHVVRESALDLFNRDDTQ